MRSDFVRRQAEAYRDAKENLVPWEAYVREVVEQWREIDHPIELVDGALSYLDPMELREDISKGRPIRVWAGGRFTMDHPLWWSEVIGIGRPQRLVYQFSRALHDYNIHNRLRLSFSPMDELYGALATRGDFSQGPKGASYAQWTDDVAMGCYYAHFGKWPEVQRPVIVEADWEGLREFLNQ